MLEKIGTPGFEVLSDPNPHVLTYLEKVIASEKAPIVYEVGVGIGATTLEIAKRLDNSGTLVLFSREKDVAELAGDLRASGFRNIDAQYGSPSKTFSGYHFELARGLVTGNLQPFDLAYVDGGHIFHLDAPAASILKEICKPGGYIIFDDWYWSLGTSPTQAPHVRPQTAQDFDSAQIDACHVQLVCKTIMDPDPRFRFVGLHVGTAVYQRNES